MRPAEEKRLCTPVISNNQARQVSGYKKIYESKLVNGLNVTVETIFYVLFNGAGPDKRLPLPRQNVRHLPLVHRT
jgi:hypothetical protein